MGSHVDRGGGSATAKYWIWVATSLNFVLPMGAALDKLVTPLVGRIPGIIGDFADSISRGPVCGYARSIAIPRLRQSPFTIFSMIDGALATTGWPGDRACDDLEDELQTQLQDAGGMRCPQV
jgi:hypothetical protein